MSDPQRDLLGYFQRELVYLRSMGQSFAARYPKLAKRLQLDPVESPDPHVERLIESVAFLTGRVQQRLDSDFAEIPAALLDALYPALRAPIPSLCVAEMKVDPTQLAGRYRIARGSQLFTETGQGRACRFRTCYDLDLWPIEVVDCAIEAPQRYDFLDGRPEVASVLRLRLATLDPQVTFADLGMKRLRFFLQGERSQTRVIYEELLGHCVALAQPLPVESAGGMQRSRARFHTAPLQAVGFGEDEAVLPFPPQSHPAYRLLLEYFVFPTKFLFFDLTEIETAGQGRELELLLLLDRVPRERPGISAENFRLGCTPIVNLFEKVSEPIRLDHTRVDYRLVPDVRWERSTEVHSLLSVSGSADPRDGGTRYAPFFAYTHAQDGMDQGAFWYAKRLPSERAGLSGTDLYLSFVNRDFNPTLPASEAVFARMLCTNRDLAEQVPAGARLEIELDAPLRSVATLMQPTRQIAPPQSRATLWRLVSHLSVNHLSLAEGGEAALAALREILKIYSAFDEEGVSQEIQGLRDMDCRKAVRRVGDEAWRGFCRGTEITLTFDDRYYLGQSAFLFASVLNRFFALYASVNSFTQLRVKLSDRDEVWMQWPPLVGERELL